MKSTEVYNERTLFQKCKSNGQILESILDINNADIQVYYFTAAMLVAIDVSQG
jgi:hypothetical protein